MKSISHVLGIVTVTLLCADSLAAQRVAPPPDPPGQFTASRVRVIEADTLEVYVDGQRTAIGIVGIKAPPGNTLCGKQAIAAVYQMLEGTTFFDLDTKGPKIDKRYRRLYRVTTSKGQSLAAELAREGLAVPEQADAASAVDISDIVAARNDARGAQRGCVETGAGR